MRARLVVQFWYSLSLSVVAGLAQAGDGTVTGNASDGGVVSRWTYRQDARTPSLGILQIETSGKLGGQPLRYDGGRIRAWLQRVKAPLSNAETSCADKVKMLSTLGIGRRADIDLNQYQLVTLNSDGSIAFIDPSVPFDNKKLAGIVNLNAAPRDWIKIDDRMEVWVITAEPAKLVQVDMQSMTIVRTIDLAGTDEPSSIGYDAATGTVWVGFASGATATLGIDDPKAQLRPAGGISGRIVRFSDGGEVSPGHDRVAVLGLDRVTLPGRGQDPGSVAVDGTPVAIGYSELSARLLVATAAGSLSWLSVDNGGAGPAERRIALPHAVSTMRLFDNGRRLLAIGAGQGSIVDVASGSIVMTMPVPIGADGIVVTSNFAYVTTLDDGHATLWSLADLRRGLNQPTVVNLGTSPTSGDNPRIARAAVSPEGSGIVVSSPADGMILQYSEGMMVASGSFSNYSRAGVGLMTVDTSLKEVVPGTYRAAVRHSEGGRYELIVAGVGPGFSSCSTIDLPTADGGRAAPLYQLKPELVEHLEPPARDAVIIRMRLDTIDENGRRRSVEGIRDLNLLVMNKHTLWQRRLSLEEYQPGRYEASVRLPKRGLYDLRATSPSQNLALVEGSLGEIALGGAGR